MSTDNLFHEIDSTLDKALAAIEAGEIGEIATLTDKIDKLCRDVLALEKTEGAEFLPKLDLLRDKLDMLQEGMESVRGILAGEISATDQRLRATKAYRPVEEKK